MNYNFRIAIISAMAACISAFAAVKAWHYARLDYELEEKKFQQKLNQIRYIGTVNRDSNNQIIRLTLEQVSGENYIIDSVDITFECINYNGLPTDGKPISLNVKPYLQTDQNHPRFVIPKIVELIFYKDPEYESTGCKAKDILAIKFQYKVLGELREFKAAREVEGMK